MDWLNVFNDSDDSWMDESHPCSDDCYESEDIQWNVPKPTIVPRFLGLRARPPIHYLSQSISTYVCVQNVMDGGRKGFREWVVRRRTYPRACGGKPLYPTRKRFRQGKLPRDTWARVIKYCQDEEKGVPR